jgi:hypothetical protein
MAQSAVNRASPFAIAVDYLQGKMTGMKHAFSKPYAPFLIPHSPD